MVREQKGGDTKNVDVEKSSRGKTNLDLKNCHRQTRSPLGCWRAGIDGCCGCRVSERLGLRVPVEPRVRVDMLQTNNSTTLQLCSERSSRHERHLPSDAARLDIAVHLPQAVRVVHGGHRGHRLASQYSVISCYLLLAARAVLNFV